jgi:hypothetical protein
MQALIMRQRDLPWAFRNRRPMVGSGRMNGDKQ